MESQLILNLSEEHRCIERLLASLLRVAAQAKEGDSVSKSFLALHLELFRSLLDRVHHGREEDILFDALLATGMRKDQGPIAVMLSEHQQGRAFVTALGQIETIPGPLTPLELHELRTNAREFAAVLATHIAKEDGVLYPMAYQRLGNEGIARIDERAKAFRAESEEERVRLMAAAERLSESTLRH